MTTKRLVTTDPTDRRLIEDARHVLGGLGYEFQAVTITGTMSVESIRTRPKGGSYWDVWNAETGRRDLAHVLTMLLWGGHG